MFHLAALLSVMKSLQPFNDRVFPGGLTYSGHPLATAAAVATIDVMAEEKMVENAAAIGENVIKPLLQELMAKHKVIGEVRGKGTSSGLLTLLPIAQHAHLLPHMEHQVLR